MGKRKVRKMEIWQIPSGAWLGTVFEPDSLRRTYCYGPKKTFDDVLSHMLEDWPEWSAAKV